LELTEVTGQQIGNGDSLLLGGLRLQTSSKGSLKAARELARNALASSSVVGTLQGRTFYAVGGTWRSLARLHMHHRGYPLHVMHEYRIGASELEEFLKLIARGSLEAIPGINIVSKQRQTLLPFGAVVLAEILKAGRPESVCISALGLREGLLFSKLSAAEQAEDPLLQAASELSVLRSRSPAHAEELIPWTEQAMAVLGREETAQDKRLRAAACLLADIGWRAHPDYRGAQSFNIISHAGFVGIDHPGRAYLALSVYYRHAGLSDDELAAGLRELAPLRYREAARALAASFRVAYLVSGAVEGVLPRTSLRRSGRALELVLGGGLGDLAGPRLESRLRQLANLGGFSSSSIVVE
jgi:exopolyphosphatase/guanosine-5'-triphosphate,3'-diphosphate pyrophosphatase